VILDHGEVKLDTEMNAVHNPDEVTLLCTLGAGESRILSRLRELDGVKRITAQPAVQPDQSTVLITFYKQPEPERRLFALLSSMNIPILHLSRSEDSLEQVFLRVIAQ